MGSVTASFLPRRPPAPWLTSPDPVRRLSVGDAGAGPHRTRGRMDAVHVGLDGGHGQRIADIGIDGRPGEDHADDGAVGNVLGGVARGDQRARPSCPAGRRPGSGRPPAGSGSSRRCRDRWPRSRRPPPPAGRGRARPRDSRAQRRRCPGRPMAGSIGRAGSFSPGTRRTARSSRGSNSTTVV